MFLDNSLVLDPFAFNAGTPKSITSSTTSTNIYDITGAGVGNLPTGLNYGQLAHPTQVFGDDYGLGSYADAPSLLVLIAATFVGAGATLTISLQEAIDNGSGGVGTWTTVSSTQAIPVGTLVAGTSLYLPIPVRPPGLGLPRFVQLAYTVTGGPFTAGAVSAGFVLGAKTSLSGSAVPNNYVTWNG